MDDGYHILTYQLDRQALLELLFPLEVARRRRGRCPLCGRRPDEALLRDEPSRREFRQSGLCQACQDEVFSEDSSGS